MAARIDIEAVQVGMFVHLDLAWWAHPFALSSFLVQTEEQVTTLRGLGLASVRWSPEKSQLGGPTAAQAPGSAGQTPAAAAAATTPPVAPAVVSAAAVEVGTAKGAPTPAPAFPAPAFTPVSTTAATPALSSHSNSTAQPATAPLSPLGAQRAALKLCAAQYQEAGTACHDAFQNVLDAPQAAREACEGLTTALVDKLMVDGEMCVRALAEPLGDVVAGHALNVTVISLLMGRVFGFSSTEMQHLGLGALLHDVGKLQLPERARHPDPLQGSPEEALYRDHVAHGVLVGQRMGLPEAAIEVLAQHHELADGTGFPQGLGLERMGVAPRIVALVNRYDNLCNPLQPALGLTPHEALSILFAQCKSKFDSTMLNAFIRMMGVYPPGSLVQLTDDRYATVVSVNSSRPLKPRVLVCDAHVPADEALLLNLDQQPDLGIRRSLKAGQLPSAVRDYLSPRPRMVYFFEPASATLAEAGQALAA